MSQQIDLTGETIVVTGAGSGIGEGIARNAAEHHMKVVLADIEADRVEAVARSLREGGATATAIATDVSDFSAVERLADEAFARFGAVRVLVNNAGVEATGYAWETVPADWHRVISVNLLGVFHGVRAFVPRMLKQGSPASIVNLSSIAALSSGPPQQSAYNASKHGVQALSECLHLELAQVDAPITVHVVNPGPVASRIFTDATASGEGAIASREMFGSYVGEHGLTGDEAGRVILDGVRNGEFWIETHPPMQEDAIVRRTQMLACRAAPALVTLDALERL
jgi:NAD(P)-dependent dehydrogenase (short-subunit alcohol dehydrogenase family)